MKLSYLNTISREDQGKKAKGQRVQLCNGSREMLTERNKFRTKKSNKGTYDKQSNRYKSYLGKVQDVGERKRGKTGCV